MQTECVNWMPISGRKCKADCKIDKRTSWLAANSVCKNSVIRWNILKFNLIAETFAANETSFVFYLSWNVRMGLRGEWWKTSENFIYYDNGWDESVYIDTMD